jgi:type IV pilus assembly protein PilP
MKKIIFIFTNIIVIVLTTVFFAFAFDIKNIFGSSAPSASKTAAVAKQAPIQKTVLPVKTPGNTPAVATSPSKNTAAPALAATAVATPAPAATAVAAPAPAATSVTTPAASAPPPVDNYSYNPVGKPDPFLPFIMSEILEKKKVEKKEKEAVFSIFPLQRAEAERYRVVGIAGDKDHRVAVCEDAAKKFYPLLIGTRIGLHNGKVVEIMADRVIVEEIENKKAKRIILKLRKN